VAAAEGVPVVIDDVAAELGFPGSQVPPVPLGDAVITVGSLSKVVWGGLRTGWIRAAAPVIGRLARLRAVHDIGGDTPAQLAAAILVDDLDAVRDRQAADLRSRHDHLLATLAELLPEWDVPAVRGGRTPWARLPYGGRHLLRPARDPVRGRGAARFRSGRVETQRRVRPAAFPAAAHRGGGSRASAGGCLARLPATRTPHVTRARSRRVKPRRSLRSCRSDQ